MTDQEARDIAGWHYEGDLAFYDLDQDLEDLSEWLAGDVGQSVTRLAVHEPDGTLVGFLTFTPGPASHEVELGLGLRPDKVGQGLGAQLTQAAIQYAVEVLEVSRVRLAVAQFNRRAIRVYERAGFVTTRLFLQETNEGLWPFIEMLWPAEAASANAGPEPGGSPGGPTTHPAPNEAWADP